MTESSSVGIKGEILSELEQLQPLDAHSHTLTKEEYYEKGPYHLFNMPSPYEMWHIFPEASSDIQPVFDDALTDAEKWTRLKGFLMRSRNTTMWRHKLLMYRLLFGLEDPELSDDNWRQVNESVKEKTSDRGWYDHVTTRLCKFQTQIRTVRWFEDVDAKYFTPVLWMEPALWLHVNDKPWYYLNENDTPRNALSQRSGVDVTSLESAKQALAVVMQEYADGGAVGIKMAFSYVRSLDCEPIEEAVSSKCFDAALSGKTLHKGEIKAFQDHLIFFIADMAKELKRVFQIHTGMQHTWADFRDSNPALLIPLVKAFPDVRFDLLHAGYPYACEMGIMAKLYPNVWLNLAWVYAGSLAVARSVLDEIIDLVPACRIVGFGSDMYYPELAYAHVVMARACLADVLASKVERDFLSAEESKRLARMLFHDTPMALYGL